MNLELYFAPGACSFVPHVALEALKTATGQGFEPRLVKLHKGENKTPEYLAMNPNGQVPVLVADGERITCHDAYAFTLLRWGGYAGVDPKSLPAYLAYVERVIAAPPVAAALERERIKLDTYKAA